MSNAALNRTGQLLLTNKSGGAVTQGDVVIVDTANAAAFTTTTTSAYISGTIGVVLEPNGIANNGVGMVAVQGYVPVINLSGTGSIGDLIKTHTVAKQGVRNAAPVVQGNFAQALGTSATPVAILWGITFFGSGSGVTRSGATTDNHLAVWNGSSADSLKDGGVAPASAAMVKLDSKTSGATFDFTSISGSYTHLKIYVQARGDTAANETDIHLTLNNDSGSNYDNQLLSDSNTTVTGSNVAGGAQNYVGHMPANTATANHAGSVEITIFNYAATTFYKNYNAICGSIYTTTAGSALFRISAGQWRNTGAVTRVTLTPAAGNFAAGSVATLYGIT
jgi:hypothetical protein